MNQKSVRLPLFFATFLALSKLSAMQEPKIISVKEFAQKSVPKNWRLNDIKVTPKTQELAFLGQRFCFESIEVIKPDGQHRRVICVANIDAKRYILTLLIKKVILDKERTLLWADWDIYILGGDFEKDETFSNPVYDYDSDVLWFKPILGCKNSLLPQLFYVFVGRYLIHKEGRTILYQHCCFCKGNIAYQADAGLTILLHYRTASGHFVCEKCAHFLAILKSPVIRVDQVILKPCETASV
ncbi:MAG: hypothetical protein WCW33_02705 [Candidatus Babeliales bacterium]|jgi:hypothetical protein